ncbi:hypothetical protein Sjap_010138 [Stephania japonica]|uniref:DUF7798 domain-containing protein n=1 Tax=Stephania japonica TaxID=461633 RepID=A0AAP0J8W7_9MAGN
MEENSQSPTKKDPEPTEAAAKGGWGGWSISPLSVLSDLQKAAAMAAEEISRNAVAAAKTATKSIEDMQKIVDESESSEQEQGSADSTAAKEPEDQSDKMRQSALDKLEKASDDSLLGQGLKVFDNSVETFASGAWQALGSAWKGGSDLVHKIENSAASLAESIQQGGLPVTPRSVAPSSLIESGKAFTVKGMQVLERVGKETMELLIAETGIEVEKNFEKSEEQADEDQLLEEVTFDRCFYIYGGPEQLEELEALSNHYALLFNRRKAKLSLDQKSFYDGKLKQVQQVFSLSAEVDGSDANSDKGKKIETLDKGSGDEIKVLCDSSVSKAAEMATGFASALAGLAANDIIQRTAGRLETIHSEGVHRLSELCCFSVSQLLTLGKSIISTANKAENEDEEQDFVKIDWPEDSVAKAKIIRSKAQSMVGYVEAVSNSFITGISDVVEAYEVAMKDTTSDAHNGLPPSSVQEKSKAASTNLHADITTAKDKIQDGLQYLAYVVLSTSMPTA